MKKLLVISVIGMLLMVFAFACSQKNNPAQPVQKGLIKAKDVLTLNCVYSGTSQDPSGLIPVLTPRADWYPGSPIAGANWVSTNAAGSSTNGQGITMIINYYIPAGADLTTYTQSFSAIGTFGDDAVFSNGNVLTENSAQNPNGTDALYPTPTDLCNTAQCGGGAEEAELEGFNSASPYIHPGLNQFEVIFVNQTANATGMAIVWSICGDGLSLSQNTTPTPQATNTFTPAPTNTPTATATPTCPGGNYSATVVPYTQFDARWASLKMPTGNTTLGPNKLSSGKLDPHTIKSDGCLLTCLAMLSSEYDPGSADVKASGVSHIFLSGNLNDPSKVANDLSLNIDSSYSADITMVPAALSSGSNYVIAEVAHGGRTHFVVVTGVAFNPTTHQCDYTIADPGVAQNKYLSQYTVNLLVQVSNK